MDEVFFYRSLSVGVFHLDYLWCHYCIGSSALSNIFISDKRLCISDVKTDILLSYEKPCAFSDKLMFLAW